MWHSPKIMQGMSQQPTPENPRTEPKQQYSEPPGTETCNGLSDAVGQSCGCRQTCRTTALDASAETRRKCGERSRETPDNHQVDG
jgi:hypothetical protein